MARSSVPPYSSVPNAVLSDPDLSASAKVVATALAGFGRNGNCFPKIATVAKATGLSVRTVHRALAALKAKGLLTWKRTGRSSSYFFSGVAAKLVGHLSGTKARIKKQALAIAGRVICQQSRAIEEGTVPTIPNWARRVAMV